MTLKRAGRPPLDAADPSVYVGVTLTSKTFDALCTRARREAVSVPEVIRRMITEKQQLKSKK